jgi:uncharacterized repeat protein (TIGR01451 family)
MCDPSAGLAGAFSARLRRMRTLTDVFAPGTAALPEGLRTLQVSPGRILEPGMTVHANFTFRNLGGGTATGFRVRFRLPEGLTYLVGTAQIDETPIDEHGGLTSLLQGSGANIGDVPAGAERHISLAYSVAPTIENGTQIAIQAAIASFEVPVIGSNIVRLVVRSRPALKNPATKLSLTAARELVPGGELQLSAQVHNSGQSSAHDVIVLLPVPANTAYVAGTARVDGRTPEGLGETEPFGLARPTIVAPTLGPGASLDVGYRVRIDPTLDDATPIVANGSVCTQELPEFPLASVTLKIPSKPSFAGEETTFHADCEDDVAPGQRVKFVVRARNVGTARASGVRVKLKLPDELTYSAGSRTIDGAPAVDRSDPGMFDVGHLEPGRSVEVALAAVVRSPVTDGQELALGARLEWSKGERVFERTLTVRSRPAFPQAFNAIERETSRRLHPGDAAAFTIRLENMGTDVAHDARLQLDADAGFEGLKLTERDKELVIGDDGSVHLNTLEPNERRTLRLEARVAPAMDDQTQLRVRATLRTAQLEPLDLGSAVNVIASRPKFTAGRSKLAPENSEVLRPNRTTACKLILVNEGTDRGRDVRVRLQLPDELRLESVDGASRDAQTIVFGEVPAQDARQATVHLRLVGAIGLNDTLEIGARVSGMNVVPFSLDPMKLATHAEASFGEGASLTSVPSDAVDSGEEVVYTLALRNVGDGAAKRLNARIDAPSNAMYAPGTTTVNEVPLLDFAGTSPLLAPNGLTLGDVGPGVEVIVKVGVIVNTPLPASAVVETQGYVTWDDTPEMIVAAEPLHVRSAPALPIVDPLLPFSVIDAAAAPPGRNGQRQLPRPEEYMELPPAMPVRNGPRGTAVGALRGAGPRPGGAGSGNITALTLGKGEPESSIPENSTLLTVFLDFSEQRLAWTVQYLEEARFSGLIAHLMVLRALFPDGTTADGANGEVRRGALVLSELVDRLFVKLRIPGTELQADDLETKQSRASLKALVTALQSASAENGTATMPGLRLVGVIAPTELADAAALLERERLVTAAPWRAATLLVGTSLQRDGVQVADFSAYRDALLCAFEEMADLTPTEFESALHQPGDVDLEVERETVVRALADQRRVTA